jgi:hypothetical protein
VNKINTPSYQGGSLLQKKTTDAKQAAQFALNHRMTGADPDVPASGKSGREWGKP